MVFDMLFRRTALTPLFRISGAVDTEGENRHALRAAGRPIHHCGIHCQNCIGVYSKGKTATGSAVSAQRGSGEYHLGFGGRSGLRLHHRLRIHSLCHRRAERSGGNVVTMLDIRAGDRTAGALSIS